MVDARVVAVARPGDEQRHDVGGRIRRHSHQLRFEIGKLHWLELHPRTKEILRTPKPATMDGVKSDRLENGVEMPK